MIASTVVTVFEQPSIDEVQGQLRDAQAELERTRSDVDEARRAHKRLQADIARMDAAIREAKAETARIRSEALDLSARRAELEAYRQTVENERREAQRLIDEAIAAIGTETLDLREVIDVRTATLDEREAELVEWEAELVAKAHDFERRVAAAAPVLLLPPRDFSAGWGRRSQPSS